MSSTKLPSASSATVAVKCIQIRVKTDNTTLDLGFVDTSTTVANLKQMIQEKTEITANSQRLALLGRNLSEFDDNDQPISNLLDGNSTLVLSVPGRGNQGSDEEGIQGHAWKSNDFKDGETHQGDTVDDNFHGVVPSNRGFHTFGITEGNRSIVTQGDRFLAGPKTAAQSDSQDTTEISEQDRQLIDDGAGPQGPAHQGETYPSNTNDQLGEGIPRHAGNIYDRTVTSGSKHHQGDVFRSTFRGRAPAGAGNHRFGNTTSTGGTLHQGNNFGQPRTEERVPESHMYGEK